MSRKVLEHGPDRGLRPYVPDFLCVEEDGALRTVDRKGADAAVSRSALTPCDPLLLEEGTWPCVLYGGGAEFFPLAHEARWRAAAAERTLASSLSEGDPSRALDTMRAAAALVNVDVDETVAELDASKLPGEDLLSAYARVSSRKK